MLTETLRPPPSPVHICGFRRGRCRILFIAPQQWTFDFYRNLATEIHPGWDLVYHRIEDRWVLEGTFPDVLKEFPHDLLIAGWYENHLVNCTGPVVYVDVSDFSRIHEEILSAGHRYHKTNLLRRDWQAYGERIQPLAYHPRWSLFMAHPEPRRLLAQPCERTLDVTFRGSLYPRIATNRNRGIEILRRSRKFTFDGPEPLPPLEYLARLHRTKIGVSFLGFGIQCLRLYEMLQAGCLVITEEEFGELCLEDRPEEGKHLVCCRQDLSDLEGLIVRYLRQEPAREKIAEEGHRWYMANFSPERFCQRLDAIVEGALPRVRVRGTHEHSPTVNGTGTKESGMPSPDESAVENETTGNATAGRPSDGLDPGLPQ